MQQISGLEFAKLVPMNVKIIFTTAFKEYAIEAYKVNAFDYLVKPILYEDFMQTCQKVFDHYMQDDAYNPIKRDGFVVVKNESKYTPNSFREHTLYRERERLREVPHGGTDATSPDPGQPETPGRETSAPEIQKSAPLFHCQSN